MNVKIDKENGRYEDKEILNLRVILSLIFFIFIFPIVNGFNVCNVEINNINNAFVVNDSVNNKEILIVDNDGDLYLEGRDHSLLNSNSEKSFYLNDYLFFNRVTSKYNNLLENQVNFPSTNSLIVNNSLGVVVASFSSNDNNIYIKGKAVANNSQAGCQADGTYCVGGNLETHDYYCDLTGSKMGSCQVNVLSSENCLTKLSVDSDSGAYDKFKQAGTVTDFTGCSGSSCTNNTYIDSCSSSNLLEYSANGSSYISEIKNCLDYNTRYCNSANVWTTNFNCGSGQCNQAVDSMVQSCSASATNYGSFNSCKDINTKTRTNIVYSPQCSSGSCVANFNPTSTPEDVACGSGNYCSGGNCITITYSWYQSGFGACSASCGPGTQYQTVYCKRNYDNAQVSDSYCGGAKPVTSQSCNNGACCDNSCQSSSNVCSGQVYYNGCENYCGVGTKSCCTPSCPASNTIDYGQSLGSDGCGGTCSGTGTKCPGSSTFNWDAGGNPGPCMAPLPSSILGSSQICVHDTSSSSTDRYTGSLCAICDGGPVSGWTGISASCDCSNPGTYLDFGGTYSGTCSNFWAGGGCSDSGIDICGRYYESYKKSCTTITPTNYSYVCGRRP